MCITKMTCIYLAWLISSMLTLLPGKYLPTDGATTAKSLTQTTPPLTNFSRLTSYRDKPKTSEQSFAACSTNDKLKKVTEGVKINTTEGQCYIALQSPDERQVVAEFFDMQADCINHSKIKIHDGPEGSKKLIANLCQGNPFSYASRNHRLVINFKEERKAPKPFSLNVYLIDTEKIYRDSHGLIKSVKFLGGCDGNKCTPNNLHSIYDIESNDNVTFFLRFDKFKIRSSTGGKCLTHFLSIAANGKTLKKLCGDGKMPDYVFIITEKLSLEFYTGNKENAYYGFEARYNVCRKEVQGNESQGFFTLPLFRRMESEQLTCVFIVHVRVKSMVTFNMTFGSNSKSCINVLSVTADGVRKGESIIDNCEKRSMDIEASYNVTIRFAAPSDRTLTANYSIENIDDEGRATSSNIADEGSTDSHIQGNISGNATFNSTDKEEFQKKEPTKEGAGSHITSIAGAIGGAIFIVVLVIVIVLVHRRKRHRGVDKPSKGKESRNDANIYSDNQDYDVMNIKRSHKTQPEKNVYGTTSTPSDVYAMTDRSGNDRMMEMSNEYDHQYFGNTYAETSTVVQTKAQRNQPNADEYGQHDFESTYTETSTSAQKRRQNTADSKDTITDEYEQQDFGAYATTSTSTRKNEPKENFYE